MRYVLLLMALLLTGQMGWAGECPPGTTLQKIGTVRTAGADAVTISTTGQLVRASNVTCAGTACVATLYDTDGNDTATDSAVDAEVTVEPGAPASTSNWQTYDPPLSFTDGIAFHDDGNVNAIQLYTCR